MGRIAWGFPRARRWLQVDALDEAAHSLLIQLLIKAGRLREAIDHYQHSAEQLRTELGSEFSARITALIRDIRPPLSLIHI